MTNLNIIDKSSLYIGETLVHDKLGKCVYTKLCHSLDRQYGTHETLYVSFDGKTTLVTLVFIEKEKN